MGKVGYGGGVTECCLISSFVASLIKAFEMVLKTIKHDQLFSRS